MRLVAMMFMGSLCTVGCKGDAQRCDEAARNYATLTFWAKADAEIAKAPAAKRASLRKDKVSAFTNELESKIDVVVTQCQSANNDDQVECMINAKTADQANECADQVGAD